MSLEQIQKEGDELFDDCVGTTEDIGGWLYNDVNGLDTDKIKSFINSRTILAYKAGEKAMLEKLLKIATDTLDCDEKLSTKE